MSPLPQPVFTLRGLPPAVRSRRAGLTLLEVSVWGVLLAFVGTSLGTAFMTSSRTMTESDCLARTKEQVRVLLHRVEKDVRLAIGDTIQIEDGGKSMVLTMPLGFTQIGVRPGDRLRYEITMAPGETANSADDNGNGLVDEARLVRKGLLGGEVVLCSMLDPAESSFGREGEAVILELATQGYLRHSRSIIRASRSISINPRN